MNIARDFNLCRGCYKHMAGRCTTYPSCWLEEMGQYKDYAAAGTRQAMITEREKLFYDLYQQGLKDGEIAKKTGYSQSTVSGWRRRNRLPVHIQERAIYASRVRRYRANLGMSQKEFGRQYGISSGSVYNLEYGRRLEPPKELLEDMEAYERSVIEKEKLDGTLRSRHLRKDDG